MTRWLGHMLAVLCMVASPSLLSAQNPDSLLWGPQPGEITVSLAAHAMAWHTAELDRLNGVIHDQSSTVENLRNQVAEREEDDEEDDEDEEI